MSFHIGTTCAREAKKAVFADLSVRLEVELEALSGESAESGNRNQGTHRPLDEDVSQATQAEFQELVAPENRLLVQLLASASTKGMGLARYEGAAGSEEDVKAWLEAGW